MDCAFSSRQFNRKCADRCDAVSCPAVQIDRKVGLQSSPYISPAISKPRRVQAFLEYPKHVKLPLEVLEPPVAYVHPILVPQLEDRAEDVDLDNYVSPFEYLLPQLDMKSEAEVGAKNAFP
jgi:hypothetical protein